MRILLDESVPEALGAELAGHDCSSVRRQGWAGLKNGVLLSEASARFDALLTADKNMEYQQNLAVLPMSVVVLRARSNRIGDLQRLIPDLLDALNSLAPRTLIKVQRSPPNP
jgi:predicted nuclease of predicted toxin-antitoxin system